MDGQARLRFRRVLAPTRRLRHHLCRGFARRRCFRKDYARLGDCRRHGDGADASPRGRAGTRRTSTGGHAVPRRLRELPQARSDRRCARAGLLSPTSGGGALAAGAREGACAAARSTRRPSALGATMGETRKISLTVNGKRYEEEVEVRVTLADFIRHQLGLTGTHLGCEHGVCGACTILFDDRSARSCLMLAVQAEGHNIIPVEGIAPSPDELHPLQQAFHENHGLQCGFCTPGILTTLIEFLRDNPDPTEQEVRVAISGNLCRCTGYQNIVIAALDAAKRLRAQAAPSQATAPQTS